MIWIELLGPSGVGKSYIYKNLVDNAVVAPVEILGGTKHEFLRNKKRLKPFIFRNFNRKLSQFKFDYNAIDRITNDVFNNGLDKYSNNVIVKQKLNDYYQYKFKEYKFLQKALKEDDVFLSEDGIMHLNYGITSDNVKKILVPDVIINLHASMEYINNNRYNRIRKNKANIIESISENEILEDLFSKNYILYEHKVTVLRKFYEDRFYEIDVENNNIESIISKVDEILKYHKKKNL